VTRGLEIFHRNLMLWKKDDDGQPLIEKPTKTKMIMPMSFISEEGLFMEDVDESEEAQPSSSLAFMEEMMEQAY